MSEVAGVSITFHETGTRLNLIAHMKREYNTQDRAAGPTSAGYGRHTHNHTRKCTERRPQEAQRWRRAQAVLQHLDADDRDQ